MKLFLGNDAQPLFSSKRVVANFIVLVLCSQFAFSVLAMKGALLPQMLELWQISKTQFGLLMSIYGIVHNIFYAYIMYHTYTHMYIYLSLSLSPFLPWKFLTEGGRACCLKGMPSTSDVKVIDVVGVTAISATNIENIREHM